MAPSLPPPLTLQMAFNYAKYFLIAITCLLFILEKNGVAHTLRYRLEQLWGDSGKHNFGSWQADTLTEKAFGDHLSEGKSFY